MTSGLAFHGSIWQWGRTKRSPCHRMMDIDLIRQSRLRCPRARLKCQGFPLDGTKSMSFISNLLIVCWVSSRMDNKEKTFLDEVKTWESGSVHPEADEVPSKMVPLDRMLKPELLKACKENAYLHDEIERKRAELDMEGKVLTTRRILFMIYNNLQTKACWKFAPSGT